MSLGSIILDVAIVLIIAFFVWRSAKRGFVRTIIEMIGYVLALILAFTASSFLSKQIYESIVRPSIVKSVEGSLSNYNGNNLSEVLNKVRNNIPDYMLKTAETQTGFSQDKIATEIQNSQGAVSASAINIADNLAKPAITYILNIILIFILFFLFMLIVRFIAKTINGAFNVPVLGTANSIMGGILGLLKGAIIACLLCVIVGISLNLLAGKVGFITMDMVESTYLFKYPAIDFNPFILK